MPDLRQIFVNVSYGRSSVLFWLRCDTLCNSRFMDYVMFAQEYATRKT